MKLISSPRTLSLLGFPFLLFASSAAFAADGLDSGDSAWIITASALVLFMTLPGLTIFYAGLARAQSVLSVMMHCLSVCCIASVLWLICGYSLAFSGEGLFIGNLDKMFAIGISEASMSGSIPEMVFFVFQMTFAVITPALIVGAYPERIKFSAVLLFSGAWLLLVYAPICHWVWGGGWLSSMFGVMDFAGGLVVHASAGVSALVFAWVLGGRRGFPERVAPPHSPGLTTIGACMLWVGWFGFNGGSELAANGSAGQAILVTHISACTAVIIWSALEWVRFGKPSLVGAVTAVIAGLGAITPASGDVGPVGGLIIGASAGALCYFAVSFIKSTVKIDDSFDVFAVHGVGGILGTLLVAPLALELGDTSVTEQLTAQVIGVLATVAWAGVITFILAKVINMLVGGMRVDVNTEIEGLDLHAHGEHGYYI